MNEEKMQIIKRKKKWLREAQRYGFITDKETLSELNRIRGEIGFPPFDELPESWKSRNRMIW